MIRQVRILSADFNQRQSYRICVLTFRKESNDSNVEVSWQVTGIRKGAYANKRRIPIEVDKPQEERGTYLHPESFNPPEGKSVLTVRYPQMIQQIKEMQDAATRTMKD